MDLLVSGRFANRQLSSVVRPLSLSISHTYRLGLLNGAYLPHGLIERDVYGAGEVQAAHDVSGAEAGRRRWKFYRDHGYEMTHHALASGG